MNRGLFFGKAENRSPELSRDSGEIAASSRTLALWTLISRLTGFVRIAAIAAVFGLTFFGNLFQAVLLVPYLLCELMAGSLITAMLPPHLVHALEKGDRNAAARIARGFLGVILPLYAGAAILVAVCAPLTLWLLTIAVDDTATRDRQILLGVPLLIFLLPQVIFYAIGAVAISVQHAHRRFAFSTAAPIIENLGTVIVLGLNALVFGVGLSLEEVTFEQVMLLGLGSTTAVALHAAAQWWGAYRLGVSLIPKLGWRDPDVRSIIRTAIPSCGSATLNSLALLAFLTATGDIQGGVIAFQIAMQFYNLPIALSAFPIAFAQSPLLSRHFARADLDNFTATYRSSQRLTLFFVLPACAAFLGMPSLLAGAVSFGQMVDSMAISLVAAVLSGLSFGLVGEAMFVVARSSAYARLDAVNTLHAMLIRIAIVGVGIPLSLTAGTEPLKLWYLGLTYSAAAVAAAAYMSWRAVAALPHAGEGFYGWLLTNGAVAAIATLPAMLIQMQFAPETGTFNERILGAVVLLSISGTIYLLLQYLRGSPELRTLLGLARMDAGTQPLVKPPR